MLLPVGHTCEGIWGWSLGSEAGGWWWRLLTNSFWFHMQPSTVCTFWNTLHPSPIKRKLYTCQEETELAIVQCSILTRCILTSTKIGMGSKSKSFLNYFLFFFRLKKMQPIQYNNLPCIIHWHVSLSLVTRTWSAIQVYIHLSLD